MGERLRSIKGLASSSFFFSLSSSRLLLLLVNWSGAVGSRVGVGVGEGEGGEYEAMSGLSSDSFGRAECAKSRMGDGDGGMFAEASRNDKSDVFAALLRSRSATSECSLSSVSLMLMSGGASCACAAGGVTGVSSACAAGGAVRASPAKSDTGEVGSAGPSCTMRGIGGEACGGVAVVALVLGSTVTPRRVSTCFAFSRVAGCIAESSPSIDKRCSIHVSRMTLPVEESRSASIVTKALCRDCHARASSFFIRSSAMRF